MIDLKERAGTAMNVQSQLNDQSVDSETTLAALAFAGELGKLLWHMKYGQDVKRSGMQRATLLLSHSVRTSKKFSRVKFTGLDHQQSRDKRRGLKVEAARADIVQRFARRAIVEWCADLCIACDGRGILGRAPRAESAVHDIECPVCLGRRNVVVDEQRVPFAHNGRGPMVLREYDQCSNCGGSGKLQILDRPETTGRQICKHCDGTGKAPVDEPGRAHALGISLDLYRSQWPRMFDALLAILDQADGGVADTMRRKMQR
ncbi:TPA: zinc finger-like domain-containing protein [Burkholderia vietnamiensis]|nr:zinc finger-like domain-containing protein [Burkholderia vietnamiensis]